MAAVTRKVAGMVVGLWGACVGAFVELDCDDRAAGHRSSVVRLVLDDRMHDISEARFPLQF